MANRDEGNTPECRWHIPEYRSPDRARCRTGAQPGRPACWPVRASQVRDLLPFQAGQETIPAGQTAGLRGPGSDSTTLCSRSASIWREPSSRPGCHRRPGWPGHAAGCPCLVVRVFAPGEAGPNAAVQPLAHHVDAAYLPEPYLTGAEMAIGAQPIIRRWRRYAAR